MGILDEPSIFGLCLVVAASIISFWQVFRARRAQMPENGGLEKEILDIQNRRRRETKESLKAPTRQRDSAQNSNSSHLIAAAIAAQAVRSDDAFNEQDTSEIRKLPSTEVMRKVHAALKRPIVFKRLLEADADNGLSHFGGKPIGPKSLKWPCTGGKERNQPLHFVMQWDCAQLSGKDATGLLPKDGVLYCFLDLEWGNPDGSYFTHQAGPTDDWQEIEPPTDIGPIFGEEGVWIVPGCLPKIDNAADYVPRTLPRFAFEPVAFDYPLEEDGQKEGGTFWNDERPVAERLLEVQNPGSGHERQVDHIEKRAIPFERPFATFPYDFASLRIIAVRAKNKIGRTTAKAYENAFPDFSKDDIAALKKSWLEEATELYELAVSQPASTSLPQDLSDEYWSWVENHRLIMETGHETWVMDAINLSLGLASSGLNNVPLEWVERVFAKKHSLASEYMRWEYPDHRIENTYEVYEQKKKDGLLDQIHEIHAPTPAHMFGPPSFVQGDVDDMMNEYVLLLELPSGGTPGLEIGEGVLQYMIKPEDLAQGRFDKVQTVTSAY